jgi:DNA-binding response OmpR family regulator
MIPDLAPGRPHGEILIVEDNISSLKLLAAILTKAGYKVRPAPDGELALRSVQVKLPDLILLDFKLPGIDGIEVCRRLKEAPETRAIPVIFISAMDDVALKVTALEAGAADYVTKPHDPSEVLARINTHLSMYRMRRRLETKTEELDKHREHLEELVEERTAALLRNEARLRRTEKAEALHAMAGSIAHNFNNMLHATLGFAAMALEALPPDSEAREPLVASEKAAARAAELSTLMLVYVGQGQGELRNVMLSSLVRDSLEALRQLMGVQISLSTDLAQEDATVRANPAQLHQLTLNLFTNAAEAIGDESGSITITTRIETLGADELKATYLHEDLPGGDHAILEIADTGCGMDGETLEKILDPFYTTKFTGRGMGMAVVAGIVRGHQGAIAIESELNGGSTVRVYLPVTGALTTSLAAQPSPADEKRESQTPRTILLVDDEDMVREVGAHMLEGLGYTVIAAAGGREAVELFRKHGGEIDLVLLDLTMPDMDGEKALVEMQRILPEVKVILCSGHDEQCATQGFTGKGLAGFLQKPYGVVDLKRRLDPILAEAPHGTLPPPPGTERP